MSPLKVWGMVAMPPESKSPAETRESHQVREGAESFGLEAERYNRARPSYPPALVERIVAASPGRDVLDVGCGTGLTGRLFEAAGCRVLAVATHEGVAA